MGGRELFLKVWVNYVYSLGEVVSSWRKSKGFRVGQTGMTLGPSSG